MIDRDFEESGNETADEDDTTMAIMHEIKEVGILYIQLVLADCLSHPD